MRRPLPGGPAPGACTVQASVHGGREGRPGPDAAPMACAQGQLWPSLRSTPQQSPPADMGVAVHGSVPSGAPDEAPRHPRSVIHRALGPRFPLHRSRFSPEITFLRNTLGTRVTGHSAVLGGSGSRWVAPHPARLRSVSGSGDDLLPVPPHAAEPLTWFSFSFDDMI